MPEAINDCLFEFRLCIYHADVAVFVGPGPQERTGRPPA